MTGIPFLQKFESVSENCLRRGYQCDELASHPGEFSNTQVISFLVKDDVFQSVTQAYSEK